MGFLFMRMGFDFGARKQFHDLLARLFWCDCFGVTVSERLCSGDDSDGWGRVALDLWLGFEKTALRSQGWYGVSLVYSHLM